MIIHQALHGYLQGHNRLACSVSLSSFDDDSMKVLSDWSEFSDGNENTYITAYPLRDCNYYVVAKTWYATEMERPGCVWTHSLLVDVTSIPDDFDFRDLLSLFKRPVNGNFSEYNRPIEYYKQSFLRTDFSTNTLIWLYTNLVGEHNHAIYKVEQVNSYYQALCMLLLQYVPLSMLNRVAICTGTLVARKFRDELNSIQFATSAGGSLSVIIEQKQEIISSICDGIVSICNSMQKEDSDTDRTIRVFSLDIEGSVKKLCAVGVLMNMLDLALAGNDKSQNFVDVVSIISSAFPQKEEGGLVKKIFCQERVSSLFDVESVVLSALLICAGEDTFDYDSINYYQRIQSLRNRDDKTEFFKYIRILINSDTPNKRSVEQLDNLAKTLNANELFQLVTYDWEIFMSLVLINRSILRYGYWINLVEEQFLPLYNEFKKNPLPEFESWEMLFCRVLYNNYPIDELMLSSFAKRINTLPSDIMDYLDKSLTYKISPLLINYCRSNPQHILNWMSPRKNMGFASRRFIVECINPDNPYIKDMPTTCWESFCSQDQDHDMFYYSYIFRLGYNWKNDFGLKCIKQGFYPLYIALAKSALPDGIWKLIEPYTASLFFWQEWDRCKKLRNGVARYLKNNGYPKSVLFDFTSEANINGLMLSVWDE